MIVRRGVILYGIGMRRRRRIGIVVRWRRKRYSDWILGIIRVGYGWSGISGCRLSRYEMICVQEERDVQPTALHKNA